MKYAIFRKNHNQEVQVTDWCSDKTALEEIIPYFGYQVYLKEQTR